MSGCPSCNPSIARLPSAVQGPRFGELFLAWVACVADGGLFLWAGRPEKCVQGPPQVASFSAPNCIPFCKHVRGLQIHSGVPPSVRNKRGRSKVEQATSPPDAALGCPQGAIAAARHMAAATPFLGCAGAAHSGEHPLAGRLEGSHQLLQVGF